MNMSTKTERDANGSMLLTRSKCCDESVSRPGHSGPWQCDGCGGYAYSEQGAIDERARLDERERAMLEADAKLRATSTSMLLTTAYALTHRMHVTLNAADASRRAGYTTLEREQRELHNEFRAQRNLIDAEIERRCAS